MKNIIDLSGKKILVTGASSGIGQAIAILISQIGGNVALVGRNKDALSDTMKQMERSEEHRIFVYDLLNLEHIEDLMKEIREWDGKKLNGLVHSAGVSSTVPLKNLNYQKLDQVMRVNYYAFIELTKFFSLKKFSSDGSIVGISSIAATDGEKCQTAYAASKAAVDASIRTLAYELVSKNMRINSIRPGVINTKMASKGDNGLHDNFLSEQTGKQLLGMGEPIDIANMAVFLLSDAARFITGRSFSVDGGRL